MDEYPIDGYIDRFWSLNCPESLTIRAHDHQLRLLLGQILAASDENNDFVTTENYFTGTAETDTAHQEIVNSMMLQQNTQNLEYAPHKKEDSSIRFSNRSPIRPGLFIKTSLNSVSPKKTLPGRSFRNQ